MHPMLRSFCAYHTHIRHFRLEKRLSAVMPGHFKPFLEIKQKGDINPQAALTVTFSVRRINVWQKKLLPILSIPFFAGMPGFVSKVYGLDENSKTFRGQYEWRSAQDAQNYINSGAGRFMRANAYPHTIHYVIEEKEPTK